MIYIRNIDIGEVLGLEILVEKFFIEVVFGVYRFFKFFLFKFVDLYLLFYEKKFCFYWFNGEELVFYVVVGVDGVLFGKDDIVIVYFVSFINLF